MTDETALAEFDEEETSVSVSQASATALARSEVEAQIDAAHRYSRSVTRFLKEALTLATLDADVAQSCMYALPRGGKTISGPSVRLAEICASAWTNLHIAARIIGVDDTNIIAQGGAWDIEKNVRYSVETRRKITDKNGNRYNDDMITMTGNAAASIALRNAIFRAIPRAYVDKIYAQVRRVAVGDASTLATRRGQVLDRLGKLGADQARVLQALGRKGIDDIGVEDLETLIGYGTAIKEGTRTVDEIFPAVATVAAATPEEQGRRMPLGSKKKGMDQAQAQQAALPTPAAEPVREREPGEDG